MLELIVVVGAWVFLAAYTAWFLSSVKRRERERAKFYERFVGIYNSSKDAIGYASLDGVLLDVNDSFCKLTGYSKEELLTRKRFQDITPKEYEEYEAKTIERILRTGEPAEYEKEFIRKDGFSVPILLTAFVVKGIDGKTLGVAVIIKDITERRKAEEALKDSEEMLRNVFAASPNAIIITDLNGNIVDCNQATVDLHGYQSREGLIGKNVLEFVAKKDHKRAIENLKKTFEQGSAKNLEYTFLTKDGCEFSGELSASAVMDASGKPEYFVAITKDITEQKLLQEKLIISEKLAAIGQLASAVGHEIRNPLGVIRNSTYFLNMKLKDNTDEKVMKHLKILEREVNSADLLISDLLDFARKKPPALEPTDLNNVVMDVLSCIFIPENIKVTTELCEIPPMLLDREQIQRVVLNLTLNAVQAMPEGGKLLIQTSKHFDSVEIAFTDTGVGISKENMEKLFTPLFSTKAKGLGLGLSICKQIVEGHDGNITVQSTVGEGSTFTVKLPMLVKKTVDEKSAFAA